LDVFLELAVIEVPGNAKKLGATAHTAIKELLSGNKLNLIVSSGYIWPIFQLKT